MTAVEFGSLFEFIRNGMSVRQDKSGDGLPITRIETISEAVVDSSRVGFAGLDEKDCNGWLLQPGDILFSHINSVEHIGKCAVYEGTPDKLVHGMNLLCLRPDKSKLTPQFGKYLIRSSAFRKRLFNYVNKAVNQASVSIGNLKPIEVSVPPVPEQKRIAAILDKADSIRRKRQEAVRLTEELLRSAFLEMFGDPVTNPKGWNTCCLGDVVQKIESGWSPVCEEGQAEENGWGVLKLGAVTTCRYLDTESKALPVGISPRPDLEVKAGDLLFTRKNTYDLVAASALVYATRPKLMLSDLIFRLKLKDDSVVITEYLWALLSSASKRKQIQSLAGGSSGSMPNISKSKLLEQMIEVPPMALQKKYAKILHGNYSIRNKLEVVFQSSNILFDSLLQSAFNGVI